MNIRPIALARPDIAELLHVERHSLGDSDLSVDEALAVLATPAHLCLGAYGDQGLIGFLSCFTTYAAAGPRLELDMLGVLPAHRNRGVATALIGEALRHAHATGCAAARAVVRNDNPASLTAFLRAGLVMVGEIAMMIWDRSSRERASGDHARPPRGAVQRRGLHDPQQAHLAASAVTMTRQGEQLARAAALDVTTLAYRGCWIEELRGMTAPTCAQLATAIGESALDQGLLEAGLLLPVADAATHAALVAQGWQEAGAFYALSWSA